MKLPLPRITVGHLMMVVVLVALDLTVGRWFVRSQQEDEGVAWTTLPMANLLVLAAPAAWRRGSRMFWGGFQVAGWAMVALFFHLSRHYGAWFFRPANAIYPWETIRDLSARTAYLVALDATCYTPPQVLVAWIVGWTLARLVARGRPTPPAAP